MNTAKNHRKYTWKFWLVFWLAAILALFAWYVFLQIQNRNFQNLKPLAKILPIGSERRNELEILADVYQKAGGFSREQTFLVLFQNDMELRPGGGFIGSFGIVKTKNGKISGIEVLDTGVFDRQIPDVETAPAPVMEAFRVNFWKMRDSNWLPDFKTNAEKAKYFYELGGGKENFDGVIGVNTNVLNSILSITGPVKINDYPGEYNDETAILQLEYQVEKGYVQQGIQKGERKSIMKEMADVLAKKAHNFTLSEQLETAKKIEEHLKRKDIQIFFQDDDLQKEVDEMGWSGRVKDYPGDYLMLVDANLNSLKSDVCIRRKMNYSVNLSSNPPAATLVITYEHTCRARDWMTTNYNNWARIYVPAGTWLVESSVPQEKIVFGEEFGKKVIGFPVYVPIGKTETITLKYNPPNGFEEKPYKLLVQKQSGSGELPVEIMIKKKDGSVQEIEDVLTGDKEFDF
ncbi:MAG: DUF4012 domain-containing protein [Patescibacteria group bacterium]|nr:DUF4012 domain-containing protein [Patescibacteria group bacterium]